MPALPTTMQRVSAKFNPLARYVNLLHTLHEFYKEKLNVLGRNTYKNGMTVRNNTNVLGISLEKPQSRKYNVCKYWCAIKLIKFRYTVPFHYLFIFIYLLRMFTYRIKYCVSKI